VILPGATLGLLGGGQLGRMFTVAARTLGYRVSVLDPDAHAPAAEFATAHLAAPYTDKASLETLAATCAAVTTEFENAPAEALDLLSRRIIVRPSGSAVAVAQDRRREKGFFRDHHFPVGPFAVIESQSMCAPALDEVKLPALLKTARFGYDGKGQARIMAAGDAEAAWAAVRGAPSLLEGFVRFDAEFSVLLCRGEDGGIAFWDSPLNVHKDGILDSSTVPAGPALGPAIAKGRRLAERIADALDYVGVLAVEFFALGGDAIFNEMAPRVHNSGHWTIEGAVTSQFENHIRAICGLPLGSTARTALQVEMRNLIGADADGWRDILADPAAHLHLYGKEPRPGRKMGHVTRLFPNG